MTNQTARPQLYLLAGVSPALEATLAARFTLHRKDPPAETRAIVGGGSSVVDAALLDRLPTLEIIAIHGVGYDGIDLAAAKARGIAVTTTPDVLTDDVADLAIGLMLAVQRRIVANDRAVRDGGWQVDLARRATGRRIGIFGLGRIGRAIAKRAAPFANELHYTARSAKPDFAGVFHADIASLAGACDVLIIAAPGGEATSHIVDAGVLAALGEDGIFINIARGSLVDEPALVAALLDGTIAGAGLDVFADEPAVPDAVKALDQVVLSPHQGSATVDGRAAMAALVVANLDAHFGGKALLTPL
ncbi:2-hydroxyacid dehydrogenase [Sphingomonas sp. CFBP 13728]|uniref:2-hydroxyacid dehydrogenase n=1 Tax=Sphingomonas sp. CFBP 13728 TaxID=2775294 RepID=UPI001782DEAB|nr:2-hydroxyacid dehydrogenase [Sphingomonas sp. CFBP 13728]MBD8619147.1 2-hydroxyacid dehydrogenase [Sphingomonas sp. CFBP 13728]